MKMSSKMERCGLSPMRKFNPLANEALSRGIKIYHMNIGQPDVETPAPFYQALRDFADPVVSYAPAPGVPVLLDAVRDYYRGIGVELERGHILPTNGTARFFSPLGVDDFIKKSSIISYSKEALQAVHKDIELFAMSEGLTAHANSIAVRFSDHD